MMNKHNVPVGLFNKIGFTLKWPVFSFFLIAIGITGCSKMDATYHDFWKNGRKVYPASPDSIKTFSGRNRIEMIFTITGGRSVTRARIYWNNKTDSMEEPIHLDGESSKDTVRVMLNNLPEGFYSFDIYTYDDKGNRSVVVNTVGYSYGDNYIASLLSRLIKRASYINDTAVILWNDPVDITSIGSEIYYKDTTGAFRKLFVIPSEDTTFIADMAFSPGVSIWSRALYVPDSTSIDTFYTAYDTVRVEGPRVKYDRAGWSVTASSYRVGNEPGMMIDGNPSTYWIDDPYNDEDTFPYTFTVDMGKEIEAIDGVFFRQRTDNTNPRMNIVEVQISNDGQTWLSFGKFVLADNEDVQYFDFPSQEKFRYFKIVCYSSYRDKPNCTLAEVGVYYR